MQREKILNINDNNTSRYTLTRMLEHAGFEVTEALTGEEGLRLAVTESPAVILLDIKLPDIDGFEVCRRLKANPETQTIPILHVTAHATGTEKKVQSIEGGADAYLTFPVERTYMIAIVRSLIRLRRAELEREQHFRGLHSKNAELSEALETVKIERSLRELFVATLSHDLRNPLAAIRLAAQSAKLQIGKPEPVTGHLDHVLSAVNRADRMIEDLLDVGLLKAGQTLPIKPTLADVREVVLVTARELRARFQVSIDIDAPATIESDHYDPSAIRRILENLLQNAIKYGDRTRPITLRLRQDDSLWISVHNLGNPIHPDMLGQLFQPFKRGDSASTLNQAGWGLGLTVVHGLVEAHQGTIQVTSTETEGTLFSIRLPNRPASVSGLKSETRSDNDDQSQKHSS